MIKMNAYKDCITPSLSLAGFTCVLGIILIQMFCYNFGLFFTYVQEGINGLLSCPSFLSIYSVLPGAS